jgi:hypothetical protein
MGSMDNTNAKHITALRQQAQKILDANKTQIDDLRVLLSDSRPLPPDQQAAEATPVAVPAG